VFTSFIKGLKSRTRVLNLPNCLTILRILLIPVIGLLLDYDDRNPGYGWDTMFNFSYGRLAAMVVAVAGLTDLLDGYYARKWKIESLLGKFLDPVADKLLLMVGLIMLMKLGRVAPWLVMVLLSREFLITGLRGVAAGEGIVISAGNFGKWKLTLQLVGLGLLMWYGSVLGIPGYYAGVVILYLALFISLISGYNYLRDFFLALNQKRDQDEIT
jgi:CDP-diacylglycerol--glycerol-3-phosphate 3-phosphatidyltransferase